MSISEHINNKVKKNNFRYVYYGNLGVGYYIIDGRKVPESEVEDMLPVLPFKRLGEEYKGENPDKTHIR
jgi:hypothetical protein